MMRPRLSLAASVVVLLLALAGCGAAPTSPSIGESVAPSLPIGESASASPQPTPSTLATPTSSPRPSGALAPDTIAEVVVTDLALRSAAGTGSDSELYPVTLGDGFKLFLASGPVTESGYDWYRVVLLDELVLPADWPGPITEWWVAAASKSGEPWIRSVQPNCPVELDIQAVGGLSREEQILCLSGQTLSLEGWVPPIYASGGCLPAEPWWLTCFLSLMPLISAEPSAASLLGPGSDQSWSDGAVTIPVAHPPDLAWPMPPPVPGTHLSITGQFDDPLARTCGRQTIDHQQPPYPPDPSLVFFCRSTLVATDVLLLE